jgi:hypothetical protein
MKWKYIRKNGIHINIVNRDPNGSMWVNCIKNRGKDYDYGAFTWGTVTHGPNGNLLEVPEETEEWGKETKKKGKKK